MANRDELLISRSKTFLSRLAFAASVLSWSILLSAIAGCWPKGLIKGEVGETTADEKEVVCSVEGDGIVVVSGRERGDWTAKEDDSS